MESKIFDVIIIGGSYAGLSAALCLGRSLRDVLVLDSETPCNRVVSKSHNFLTQDGNPPQKITDLAVKDLKQYKTVSFRKGLAITAQKIDGGFEIGTKDGFLAQARKLIFATGLRDIMPAIKGYAECWGKSVLHCPYCHGYEVKSQCTGILGNGDFAYEMVKSIANWTNQLTVFTNGKAVFSESQLALFKLKYIRVIESSIKELEHRDGLLQAVVFNDGSRYEISFLYAHPHSKQQCDLFKTFGCTLNSHGCIETDVFQKTGTYGIYAAGDCTSVGRAISVAVAAGTVAGMFVNKELIEERFER